MPAASIASALDGLGEADPLGPWLAERSRSFGVGSGEGVRVSGVSAGPGPVVPGDGEGVRLGAGDGVGFGLGSGSGVGPCVGSGDGDATAQTSSMPSAGGSRCVAPLSPVPQTHPSRSPSPTRKEPAPVDAHVQPPRPSPCQYPHYSGYSAKQSSPAGPTPSRRQTAPPPIPNP